MTSGSLRAASLSDAESRVLALIARGLSNAEIADLLGVSRNTLKTRVRLVYRKVGVSTRSEAIASTQAARP